MPTDVAGSGIASFGSSGTITPDQLLVGEQITLTRSITLISGQNLSRGAVLGKITTGGKYTLSLSASADGSQTPDCVLADDCNASAGDKTTIAYFQAGVNQERLILGTGHTKDSIREGLRVKGIQLISVIPG